MIDSVNEFETHVGARLLDFFDSGSPWNRKLWNVGLGSNALRGCRGSRGLSGWRVEQAVPWGSPGSCTEGCWKRPRRRKPKGEATLAGRPEFQAAARRAWPPSDCSTKSSDLSRLLGSVGRGSPAGGSA